MHAIFSSGAPPSGIEGIWNPNPLAKLFLLCLVSFWQHPTGRAYLTYT